MTTPIKSKMTADEEEEFELMLTGGIGAIKKKNDPVVRSSAILDACIKTPSCDGILNLVKEDSGVATTTTNFPTRMRNPMRKEPPKIKLESLDFVSIPHALIPTPPPPKRRKTSKSSHQKAVAAVPEVVIPPTTFKSPCIPIPKPNLHKILRNPNVLLVSRAYYNKFKNPADEDLGQRPCCCGTSCIVFSMNSTELDITKRVKPEHKKPAREFLYPDPKTGLESTHTNTNAGMCVHCLMNSTTLHASENIGLRIEPVDIIQAFRVNVTDPGEFCAEDCWPLAIDGIITGVPYPIPMFNLSKFSWVYETDQVTGKQRAVIQDHFRIRPASW
jgi:hypothetical protein